MADWGSVDRMMEIKNITPQTLGEKAFKKKREYFASRAIGGYPFVGTPDRVAEELADLSRAGIRGIAFSMINYLDELPLFRDEVLPRAGAARACAPRIRAWVHVFLAISTPRPERPSDFAESAAIVLVMDRQVRSERRCAGTSTRASAAAPWRCSTSTSNETLHRILTEWADIIPAEFDTYPLVDVEAAKRLLASQVAAKS